MSLSSLIVQREIASIRAVEEALSRQVLYGGDLATNLLEVTAVEEWRLAHVVAESYGLTAAPSGELPRPTEQALHIVPAELAVRRSMLPLEVSDDRLIIVLAEPLTHDDADQLAFALGLKIEQRIALLARVHEALELAYGTPLERRMARVIARLAGGPPPSGPSSRPPLLQLVPELTPAPRPPSVQPPRKTTAVGFPAPSPAPWQVETRKPPEVALKLAVPGIHGPEPVVTHTTQQMPSIHDIVTAPPPPLQPGAAQPMSVHEQVTAPPPPPTAAEQGQLERPLAEPVSPPPSDTLRPSFQRGGGGAPRPARRRRGPLTFEIAKEEAEAATDRDTLLDLAFDFCRQFFDYSAMFVVHADVAEGRDAFGDGLSRERIVSMAVPLEPPSVLRAARDRRAATVSRPDPSMESVDTVLLSDLGRTVVSKAIVLPIVVRGRVVALFYGDVGNGPLDESTAPDAAELVKVVGQTFERIIVRKKLAGISAGAPGPQSESARIDIGRVVPKRPPSSPPIDRTARAEAFANVVLSEPKVSSRPPPGPIPSRTPSPTPEERKHPTWPETPVARGEVPAVLKSERPPEFKHLESSPGFMGPRSDRPPPMALEARPASEPPQEGRTAWTRSEAPAPIAPVIPSAPPPPNAVVSVRPQGPPIPREEPLENLETLEPEADQEQLTRLVEGDEPAAAVQAAPELEAPTAEAREPEAEAQTPEAEPEADAEHETLDDDAILMEERLPRRQLSAPELDAHQIDEETARALLREIELEEKSAYAVSFGPRVPPSSVRKPATLPSIIVDTDQEYVALVERMLAGSEEAESELLRDGPRAMPAIMSRFPGPTTMPRDALKEPLPHVTECGPILSLIARERRVALPFVLDYLSSDDIDARTWATFLITELAYPEAVDALVPRLFDSDPRVRLVAKAAAKALAPVAHEGLLGALGKVLRDPRSSRHGKIGVLDTFGDIREPLAVPLLIRYLDDEDEEVATVARRSLIGITRQDFARDTKKWLGWWGANSNRHRLEWLIDALVDDTPGIRRAAGEELKAITREGFGYYDDLPKKERERAQQRYRDWWASEGRARFSR